MPQGAERAHVWVHGIVQGVFFRASTVERAQDLGVNGWVRNLRDGGVEAVFEGEADAVQNMVSWMRTGPQHAIVDNVRIAEEEPHGDLGFRIAY